MSKTLYTYALLKSLYEEKKDYIDGFWPFVLKVLSSAQDHPMLTKIQQLLKDQFGLDIPEHSLMSIITRAKRNGYIRQERKSFSITTKGISYLDSMEPEANIERRINEALRDIKAYLEQESQSAVPTEQVRNDLLSFVYENIDLTVEFCNPNRSGTLDIPKVAKAREIQLFKYFEMAQASKPAIYETLRDIVLGSAISVLACQRDIAEANKRFGKLEVFLDTNFLFCLMDLDFTEFCKPVHELFNMLQKYDFEIKVFDFTIEEMVGVLMRYVKEEQFYSRQVRVNSIFSSLKQKGWTTEGIRDFVRKIEEKIWKIGVDIQPTNIDLDHYEPKHEEYLVGILKYKPFQWDRNRNHDLAAIEKITEIRRGKPIRDIEISKAFFLTSDLRLAEFDYRELWHRERVTVCEVIPGEVLTNILWLKDPSISSEVPMKTVMYLHAQRNFVDRAVWRRFYENITNLKKDGSIQENDILMLLYDHHIESVLLKFDESEADKITPKFICDEVQSVRRRLDAETQGKLEAQREMIQGEFTKRELEKEEQWQMRMERIKNGVKAAAQKDSKRFVDRASWLAVSAVAALLFVFLNEITRHWDKIEPVAWVISVIMAVGFSMFGRQFTLGKFRERFETKRFNKTYRTKLQEVGLHEET
jgi:hypothetical protein